MSRLVQHRRNHAITALGLLAGAALIAWGASRDLVLISSSITVGLAKGLGFDLRPSGGLGAQEGVRGLLLASAVLLGVMGLLLLVTRIRFLGLFWRLIALVVAALPAMYAFVYWRFIDNPASLVEQDADGLHQFGGLAVRAVTALGVIELSGGPGLWMLTVGSGLAIVSVLVPAFRSVRYAPPSPSPPETSAWDQHGQEQAW